MDWKLVSSLLIPIALALGGATNVFPAEAHAQSPSESISAARAAARELGQQGIAAYMAGKYAEAQEKLDKGYQLFATPTLGLWSARAHVQVGRWVDAAERYRETLRLSDSVGDRAMQAEALDDAKRELDVLLPKIPMLTIHMDGGKPEETKFTLDGVAVSSAFVGVPRPTNPGEHRLVATWGDERVEEAFNLIEGEKKQLRMRSGQPSAPSPLIAAHAQQEQLSPARAAANIDSTPATSAWVPVGVASLAIGGAGLVAATVTYFMTTATCPDATCRSKPDQSKYDTLQAVSTWSFWPGALLAAAGAGSLLFGLRSHSDDKVQVRVELSPTGASLRGTF